jgi:outer membrane protein W
MKIKTTLALVAAAALAASASPAFAKASIQSGQNICKAAFAAQTPAPSTTRLVGDQTRVNNDTLVYVFKVKVGDAAQTSVTCTVDRDTNTASLNPPLGTLSASAK